MVSILRISFRELEKMQHTHLKWLLLNLLRQLVQEMLLARIRLMADECTDISTVEELSIYCRWVEDGIPVEHFLEILPL